MDTFLDSSWYFLRYLDSKNTTLPCDPEKANKYMPVDLYVGGKEHGTVKPVLSGHPKIDKTNILKANCMLMKVESIAECSLGALCNTFDLH